MKIAGAVLVVMVFWSHVLAAEVRAVRGGMAAVDINLINPPQADYGDAPDVIPQTGRQAVIRHVEDVNFRISFMGNDSEPVPATRQLYAATGKPAVAYNWVENEFVIVWSADDDTPPVVNNELEIYGQRVSGVDGSLIGSRFRISTMGNDAGTDAGARTPFFATTPEVAWNSRDNEYLVVWCGDDDTPPLVDDEREIFGQRLDSKGALQGGRMRISYNGPNGSTLYRVTDPSVAYNANNNEYLAVWRGEDNTPPLVAGEFEVFAQRLTGSGAMAGANFRVSIQGNDAEPVSSNRSKLVVHEPDVAWNSSDNTYLVVWHGDSDVPPLVDNEFEVFGQLLAGSDGSLLGGNLRISYVGPNGSTSYNAYSAELAYNANDNQFLVVWEGDDNTAPLVDNEIEVFGQALTGYGAQNGSAFRVSEMGPAGDTLYLGLNPDVAYCSRYNYYYVVWQGSDMLADKYQVFGRCYDASSGAPVGPSGMTVGSGGDFFDPNYDATRPALAFNPAASECLVAWHGDDDTPPLVDGEFEIMGQRVIVSKVPDYNTSYWDNGPAHYSRTGLRIGSQLDDETVDQQHPRASGDDDNGFDDEDGLADVPGFHPGGPLGIEVEVLNTTVDGATLYGWVDFNWDGVFDNATERASAAVPSGTSGNVTLDFGAVPSTATNSTYLRLRLSTGAGAANPTGFAVDGEVEDHLIYYQPIVLGPMAVGAAVDARFRGERGVVYQLQGGDDIQGPWTNLGAVEGTGSEADFTTAVGSGNKKYLRLLRAVEAH